MRANLLVIVLISVFIRLQSQNPSFAWAKAIGSSSYDEGLSIAVDVSGNLYITGYFKGTADFDPGPSSYTLSAVGLSDIFIAKYDVMGNFLWAKQITDGNGLKITTDVSGNVCLTGQFRFSPDFDPGPGVFNLTSAGNVDIFILKLDGAGNFLWAKRIGGTGNESANGIKTDAAGNVFTTGDFGGVVDFDPGPSVSNFTSTPGFQNIFINKLDVNGNFVWAKQMTGGFYPKSYGIDVDAAGNIYTTGHFDATLDFDPGPGATTLTPTSTNIPDIFISKYNSSGNLVWVKQIGGVSDDWSYSIAVDASSNVFTTGVFKAVADFDPGSGVFNLTPVGGTDIYVNKLDLNGNFVWAKQFTGTASNYNYSSSLVLDASGNVYTTGIFDATCDFDPGVGIFNFNSAGGYDVFISKLNNSGNFMWAAQISGPNMDYGQGIALSSGGSIYTTGYFYGTMDADPGFGTSNITSVGFSDIFIHKLDQGGVGIEKQYITESIEFYPNPTNSFVTFINSKNEIGNVEVYNLIGEIIFKAEVKENKIEIDLSKQASGIYFVKTGNTVTKIIKE